MILRDCIFESDKPVTGQSASMSGAAIPVASGVVAILCYFLVAIVLQTLTGAYRTEYAGYPDSAAHQVTSIMLTQYIRSGIFRSPLEFAEQFYLHYPKVAIGHWPPFYYFCAGIWGLLFGVGHVSFLVFMAFLSALLAFLVRLVIGGELGPWPGTAAGMLLLLLPPVREGSQLVMLDTMVALLSLLAGYSFVRFLREPTIAHSVLFGLLASCTILTKISGMSLALMPLFSMWLMKDWSAIKRRAFWLSALVVALVAGPWTLYFMRSEKNGLGGEIAWSYTWLATKAFAWFLIDAMGPFLFVIAIYGIWRMVVKPFFFGGASPVWAMLFALLSATLLLQLIIPSGIEQRYLMTAFPSLAAFAIAGTVKFVERLREHGCPTTVQLAAAITFLVVGVATLRSPHIAPPTGFSKAVEYVVDQYSDYPKVAILVCSDAIGEGEVVSELAAREPKPDRYFVLRASKQLSSADWIGRNYHVLFDDPQRLQHYLESVPITLILVDRSVEKNPAMMHILQVESILAKRQTIWTLDNGFSPIQGHSPRNIEVFAIKRQDYRVPTHITVDMQLALGRNLEATD
jgi:Dolichyl-phosphate-mannose-protein mannosyltransferase